MLDSQASPFPNSTGYLPLPSLIQPTGSPNKAGNQSPAHPPSQSGVARDQFSAAQLSRLREPPFSYPSPTDSNNESPPISSGQTSAFLVPMQNSSRSLMPPPPSQYPLQAYNSGNDDLTSSPRTKRARFHSAGDVGSSATACPTHDLHGRPRSFDSYCIDVNYKTWNCRLQCKRTSGIHCSNSNAGNFSTLRRVTESLQIRKPPLQSDLIRPLSGACLSNLYSETITRSLD